MPEPLRSPPVDLSIFVLLDWLHPLSLEATASYSLSLIMLLIGVHCIIISSSPTAFGRTNSPMVQSVVPATTSRIALYPPPTSLSLPSLLRIIVGFEKGQLVLLLGGYAVTIIRRYLHRRQRNKHRSFVLSLSFIPGFLLHGINRWSNSILAAFRSGKLSRVLLNVLDSIPFVSTYRAAINRARELEGEKRYLEVCLQLKDEALTVERSSNANNEAWIAKLEDQLADETDARIEREYQFDEYDRELDVERRNVAVLKNKESWLVAELKRVKAESSMKDDVIEKKHEVILYQHGTIQALTASIEAKDAKNLELHARIKVLEDEVLKKNDHNGEVVAEAAKRSKLKDAELGKVTKMYEGGQLKLAEKDEEIKELKAKIAKKEDEKKELKQKLEEKEVETSKFNLKLGGAAEEVKMLKRTIEQEVLGKKALEHTVGELGQTVRTITAEVVEVKKVAEAKDVENRKLMTVVEEEKRRFMQSQKENTTLKASLEAKDGQLATISVKLEAANIQISRQAVVLKAGERDLEIAKKAKKALSLELAKLKDDYGKLDHYWKSKHERLSKYACRKINDLTAQNAGLITNLSESSQEIAMLRMLIKDGKLLYDGKLDAARQEILGLRCQWELATLAALALSKSGFDRYFADPQDFKDMVRLSEAYFFANPMRIFELVGGEFQYVGRPEWFQEAVFKAGFRSIEYA